MHTSLKGQSHLGVLSKYDTILLKQLVQTYAMKT
jgi:hypothetical protein